MGTCLEITNLRHDQEGDIHLPQDDLLQSLTLSQEFLYEIIVNDEITNILSPQEVDLISPNWGEITLKSTDPISSEKRETYLRLLTEVIKTNSRHSLTQFLVAEGIVSSELDNLKRDPQKVLTIIEKMEEEVKLRQATDSSESAFGSEFRLLKDYLRQRIKAREYVLIEFSD